MAYKTDWLKIKITDEEKLKKIKSFIKRNTVDDVVFFYNTKEKDLMVRCCMRYNDYNMVDFHVPFELESTPIPKFEKVRVKVTPAYEEMKWLLSTEYVLDCNSHNLEGISIKGSDCDRWLDTLFIRKGNKLIRHDEICFDGYEMFK